MAKLITILRLGPVTGHLKFCERFEFVATVAGHERQRKQKKRLQRTGNERGRCTRLVVGLFSEF